MSTVLDKLSPTSWRDATLFSRVQTSYEEKMKSRTEEVAGGYQQRINSINAEIDKWRSVQSDVGTATSDLSTVLGTVKSLKAKINSMITTVNQAMQHKNDSDFNAAGYAASLDSYLKGLHSDVASGSGRGTPNMVSKTEPTYTYIVDIYNSTTSVNGNYLGSDYHIEDSEGKWWVPNRDSNSLERFDSYPDTTSGIAAPFDEGVTIDNLSGDSVDFTVGGSTASPTSYSGTISRSGLEIMDSWYYDGLSTDEGRQRALDDLYAAKEAIDLEVKRYEGALSVAKFYEERANSNIKSGRNEANQELLSQAAAVKEVQDSLTREYQQASGRIARAMAVKTDYARMFAPFITSKMGRLLNNIWA